ncbi:hypothetical protein ACJDU8_02370 [Clostridium sp. WILCCON 0269]|uniref:Uncharacterized protein n=1 Tax=Candidatus Clostridium eludens TaxID=3381663 RepID=A0ABW8SGR2_9CLOT
MINNEELEKTWEEIWKEHEEDMNKNISIIVEDDLREKLIGIFGVFDRITYEIDWELTEVRYGRKICSEDENIFFSYKNKVFEGIVYLFDYMSDCHIEGNFVKGLVESFKYFYKKLTESKNIGTKEIFIPSQQATDMYILIEKMFDKDVKRGFKNNVLDYLFVSQGQEIGKKVFIGNLDALSYVYNKIANAREIPKKFRIKISL